MLQSRSPFQTLAKSAKSDVAPATSELSPQGSGTPSAVDHPVHERSKSYDEFGCSLTVAGDPIERQPDSSRSGDSAHSQVDPASALVITAVIASTISWARTLKLRASSAEVCNGTWPFALLTRLSDRNK
jgi:hypothetical protein